MFVERKDGQIIAAYAMRQPFDTENIPDNNVELLAFLNRKEGAQG